MHYSAASPDQTPQQIQNYHMDSRGWSDIGYNFLVDDEGRIYEGRGWTTLGAHASGHNTATVGVCFIGRDGDATAAAKAAIRWLYDQACAKAGRSLAKLGHRDIGSTECPGDELYAWVRAGMPVSGGSSPAPSKPAALVVDGILGPLTIRRWQRVMGTPVDGVISRPSVLVRAVQMHLNAKIGAGLVVDGVGIRPDGRTVYKTTKALQRYLGTPADGVLSLPTSAAVKALQRRLNGGKF